MPVLIIKGEDQTNPDPSLDVMLSKAWDIIQLFDDGFDHKQYDGLKPPKFYALYVTGKTYAELLVYRDEDRQTDSVGFLFNILPDNLPTGVLNALFVTGQATVAWVDLLPALNNKNTGPYV